MFQGSLSSTTTMQKAIQAGYTQVSSATLGGEIRVRLV